MSDLLGRIVLAGNRRAEERIRAEEKAASDLESFKLELGMFLDDLIYNTMRRYGLTKVESEDRAPLLHMKQHHQTYPGYQDEEALDRTRAYFGRLLWYCDFDLDFLMTEYGHALDRMIPIRNDRYQWAPRAVPASYGLTVSYNWRVKTKVTGWFSLEEDDQEQ